MLLPADDLRAKAHLYRRLLRELVQHAEAGRIVIAQQADEADSWHIRTLLAAAADAVNESPFPLESPEGEA